MYTISVPIKNSKAEPPVTDEEGLQLIPSDGQANSINRIKTTTNRLEKLEAAKAA